MIRLFVFPAQVRTLRNSESFHNHQCVKASPWKRLSLYRVGRELGKRIPSFFFTGFVVKDVCSKCRHRDSHLRVGSETVCHHGLIPEWGDSQGVESGWNSKNQ